jgi:phosphomannomutase
MEPAIAADNINPAIVRSYDIRGHVGLELTERDAHALGLAFATSARDRGLHNVAVCRDGRLSSPALQRVLVQGLLAGGLSVYPVGLGPTPLLHYAVRAARLDGGIMVTASHNPSDQNGFKLLLEGEPVHGKALRALVAIQPVARAGGRLEEASRAQFAHIRKQYVAYLAGCAAEAPPLRIVWDCGNGAVGALIAELTGNLPGYHTLINSRVDGRFPAHHPDPSVARNLRQLSSVVTGSGADLGIAFDGDGDRIGVVDSAGEIVWPDQLLLLLAADVLATDPGATIVGDVKSSRVLFDGIRGRGGRAVMAPSGYVLVREAMLHEDARLAGEMSGHILFADCWHRTDDALFAAMRVLLSIGRQNLSLAKFRETLPPTATTPELRLSCLERRKDSILCEVAERLRVAGADVDQTDGLRVTTSKGWWLLRRSGTEPKLTARCEADSAEALEMLKRDVELQLRLSGVEVGDTLWPM